VLKRWDLESIGGYGRLAPTARDRIFPVRMLRRSGNSFRVENSYRSNRSWTYAANPSYEIWTGGRQLGN
jgi:hypothetical protein